MLGQVRHFEHHAPSHAHVTKDDHRPGDLTMPVVDWGGGVFNGSFVSVPSHQDGVPAQPHGFVQLNGQFQRIRGGLMRLGVDNVKHFSQRMTSCLVTGPSRHLFGHDIQVGHIAQNVDTQYGRRQWS